MRCNRESKWQFVEPEAAERFVGRREREGGGAGRNGNDGSDGVGVFRRDLFGG